MLRPFVPFVIRNFSLFWRNKLVDWLPIKPLKELRQITKIMYATSKRIFEEKKAAMATSLPHESEAGWNSHARKDIMSIMRASYSPGHAICDPRLTSRSARQRAVLRDRTIDRLGSHWPSQVRLPSTAPRLVAPAHTEPPASTIIFAGVDNTAVALSRILHILAREPAMQARLRTEIRQAQRDYAVSHWDDTNLPYDILMGLPYLDAVLRETLRMHPPTSMLSRM